MLFEIQSENVSPLLIHSIWKVSIKLDSKKADRHANIDMGFPDPKKVFYLKSSPKWKKNVS